MDSYLIFIPKSQLFLVFCQEEKVTVTLAIRYLGATLTIPEWREATK